MNYSYYLIPLSVILPLIVGFALSMVKKPRVAWMISLATALAVLWSTFHIFIEWDSSIEIITIPIFSGMGISFAKNSFGLFYACLCSSAWLVSTIISQDYPSAINKGCNRYFGSLIVALSATLGIFYAADLLTLFIFFEIMSLSSFLWVIQIGDKTSIEAGKNYLTYGVTGGLFILMGLFMLYSLTGDLVIENLAESIKTQQDNPLTLIASIMMLIGFGAKACVFTLHDWAPRAYRAAPAPLTALLSGMLSKTGVYGILIITVKLMSYSQSWAYFLLTLSVLNMIVGGALAFMSGNLKRTVAYSSVSQIGFILWGVALTNLLGDHNTYAAYGTVFHMINHSLIKLLLFNCTGVIYKNTATYDLNKLKGYGRGKPWLMAVFGVGAVSLMGIPFFSGYVSKTLLHEAVVELMHIEGTNTLLLTAYEWMFLLAGGLTFAYMLKIFICLFIEKGEDENTSYTTPLSKVALTSVAIPLLLLGATPNLIFAAIGEYTAPFMNAHATGEIHYFSWVNLQGSLISIAIGLIFYFVVARKTVLTATDGYKDYNTAKFNTERIYKPIISVAYFILSLIFRIVDISLDLLIVVVNRLFYKSVKIPKSFFEGKKIIMDSTKSEIHITYSLSYSLLLFGIGFMFTILYLLVIGTR